MLIYIIYLIWLEDVKIWLEFFYTEFPWFFFVRILVHRIKMWRIMNHFWIGSSIWHSGIDRENRNKENWTDTWRATIYARPLKTAIRFRRHLQGLAQLCCRETCDEWTSGFLDSHHQVRIQFFVILLRSSSSLFFKFFEQREVFFQDLIEFFYTALEDSRIFRDYRTYYIV